MRINEVCIKAGLTKKAVTYYEKQNLIKPVKAENGYRDYSESDLKVLKEISLYRKLDISIKDIESIINSSDKKNVVNKIMQDKYKKEAALKMQRIYLNRILAGDFSEDVMKKINDEIIESEKSSGQFVKNELLRAFPSGIGKYLAYHFAPYLNEDIDTEEKYEAWLKIIDFLDNVPEFKIPRVVEMGYENMSDEMFEKINNQTKNKMDDMMNAEGEDIERYEKEILKGIEKQSSKSFIKMMSPFYKFKRKLNEFFVSSGYYKIFIPNMKILSRSYKDYSESLMLFNERMEKKYGIMYDENMMIVKNK